MLNKNKIYFEFLVVSLNIDFWDFKLFSRGPLLLKIQKPLFKVKIKLIKTFEAYFLELLIKKFIYFYRGMC